MRIFLVLTLLGCLRMSVQAELVAAWDFQTTNHGGTALVATGNQPRLFQANFGLGTLYLDGSHGAGSWATNEVSAFGGTTLNTSNGLATITTGQAALALVNSTANGKYAVFAFSMAGRKDLRVTYASQRSSSGFTNQLWEASSNGSSWLAVTNITSVQTNFSLTGILALPTISVLNNAATAYLRLSGTGASSASGNNRVDNLQFHASAYTGPILTSIFPTAGAVGDGVTILGVNFGASPVVRFNGAVALVTVNTAGTEIFATVPAAATTGKIHVEVEGQPTAISTVDFTVNDATLLPPEVNGGTLTGQVGLYFSNSVSVSGNPTNFAVVSGLLPAGLALQPQSGLITGTPQQATNGAVVRIMAANAAGSGTNDVTFQIAKGNQVISFGVLPPLAAGGPGFPLTATASSGLPVNYVSVAPKVATVAGTNLWPSGEGTTVVTACQAGNADWNAAAAVSQDLRVYPPNLISWNFDAASPAFGVPPGWTVGPLVQGNNNGSTLLLGSTSASGGYVNAFGMAASGGNNAAAAARPGPLDPATSTYFEFGLVPAGNQPLVAITNISLALRSSPTGPQAFSLRSSADGFASELAGGTISTNSTWSLRSITNLNFSLDPAATHVFRIYGHSGASNAVASTANWRIDDLLLAVRSATAQPMITSPNQLSGSVGEPLYYRITASGLPTFYSATGLPEGLQLDPFTGWITGIPQQPTSGQLVTLAAVNDEGEGTATLLLSLAPAEYREVSFTVDMNVQRFQGLFNPALHSLELRGDFNQWAGGQTLADLDGDGIYQGTFTLPGAAGAIRSYKFTVSGGGGLRWESLGNRNGQALNRLLTMGTPGVPMQASQVFFADQAQARFVTFSVNLGPRINQQAFDPLTETVEVRGSFNEWIGGLTLTDPDGDAVYTGNFPVAGNAGSSFQFLFFLGNEVSGTYESLAARSGTLGPDRQPMIQPTVFFNNDDGIGPVLSLLGDAEVTIPFGGTYTGLTATAVDAVDGTRPLYTWSNVQNTVPGRYWIYYYAWDVAGNLSWITRAVTVLPAVPVIPAISDLPDRSVPAGQPSEPMAFSLSGFQPQRTLRAMAANLTSGNYSPARYDEPGTRILRGLTPDVVMIQEFNIADNTEAGLRSWVDSTFGTDFRFYRETGKNLPNGIISRWPILSSGFWDDGPGGVGDRELAWARIDIPGERHLWVVSVHLKASAEFVATRDAQVQTLVSRIQTEVPAEDYLMIGGDFNTYSTNEACLTRIGQIVDTSEPRPVDQGGNPNSNSGRYNPYDWVLAEPELDTLEIPVKLGPLTFSSGLVFDSRNFSDLSLVSPVQFGDSGALAMQHMAVVRDFALPDASLLSITVESSDPTLVPVENVVISGDGLNRTLTVTPLAGRTGSVTLTVTASEGTNLASETFILTVTEPPGTTFANWSGGAPLNSVNLGKYAIGGASDLAASSEIPVMTVISNSLSLTAVVRKNDSNLTVGAEWVTDLADGWSTYGVNFSTNGLSQPTDPGLERRKYTVTYDPANEPRKFLRLKATLAP